MKRRTHRYAKDNRRSPMAAPSLGGGFTPFDPASLFSASEKGVAYDYTDVSKLFQSSNGTTAVASTGDPIGFVTDLSPNLKHAIQAIAGSRPLYQGCGAFDGTDDQMAPAANIDFSGVDKITLVMSVRVVGVGNQGPFQIGAGGVGSCNALFLAGAAPDLRGSLAGSAGPSQISIVGDTANTVNRVYTALYDIAGAAATDEIKLRKTGTQPAQTVVAAGPAGTGNFANTALTVGQVGGAFFMQGNIYRMIVIGRTLNSAEIASAETWCGAGAGVVV